MYSNCCDKELKFWLSKKIRQRRRELEYTQEGVADTIDCNVNHYGKIERGLVNPSFTIMVKIAKALHLSPRDLMPD